MIFALDYLNDREWVTSKLSCHLRISKSLIALLFRCLMNVSSRTRLPVGFRCFEGHFRTRWCLRHVFGGVMHHCVVRRSGSVPTEIGSAHQGGSVVQTRIHRNIAKQRLFRNPTDLRQFFDHGLTEISVFEKKSLHYFKDIRNIMGVFGFIL